MSPTRRHRPFGNAPKTIIPQQHRLGESRHLSKYDVPAMGGVERLRQLVRDVDHLSQRQQRAARRGVRRLAVHELHHDEHAAVGVADLVDPADEGMIERSGGRRLATETLDIILAPAERIWRLVRDPRELAHWSGTRLVEASTRAIRAGDQLVFRAGVFPITFDVVDLDAPGRLVSHNV
jgi:hypothetical protein